MRRPHSFSTIANTRNPSVQRCAPLAAVIVASLACFAVSAASEDLQHDAAQAPSVWKWGGVYKTDLRFCRNRPVLVG